MRGYKEVPCHRAWIKGQKLVILLPSGLYDAKITHKYERKKRKGR